MAKTFYSLFRGVGGADQGAEDAGLKSIGGVEYEAEICTDCDRNFPYAPTTLADIRDVDPSLLPIAVPDVLHASPSCKNASVANQTRNEDGTKETEFDRECGLATCRFINYWKPSIFTLENVYPYRNFDSFGYILEALRNGGYSFDYWHLNAADYGVPQTRRRLFLVAKRGNHRIVKPPATHHDPSTRVVGQMSMFDEPTLPWVGWYEAIEDLIPLLPDSEFADWQLARLPEHIKETMMRRPSSIPQAILFANTGGNESYGKHHAEGGEPAGAITIQSLGRAKALLVGGANTSYAQAAIGIGVSQEDEPSRCVNASNSQFWRAFVIDGANASRDITCLDGKNPIFTIQANEHGSKAFVVDCQDACAPVDGKKNGLTVRYDVNPIFTITAGVGTGGTASAYTGHRVVALSMEALARLQSFPDGFLFSTKKSQAAKEIGNAVPPLMYRRVIESVIA